MNSLKLFDFSEKKSKKYLAILFYCLVGLIILYFCLKKRAPAAVPRAIPEKVLKEDRRPRLSVSGSLISPEALPTLSKLGRFTRLSLIFKVSSNDEEEKIREMLSNVQHLQPHHVLFCETDIGYKALVRQLSPKLHIEESLSMASEMSSYVNAIAMVTDKECEYFYQLLEFQDCQSKVIRILGDLRRTFTASLLAPNRLQDNDGARYKYKKLGRGRASGKGKTSTRGHKGQNAREGGGVAPYFEGGQTSIVTRIPKWGFNRTAFRPNYDTLNFSRLYYFIDKGRIDATLPIRMQELFEAGVFSRIKTGVKLLARGLQLIDRPLHFEVADASKAAVDAVKAKGGSVTLVYKTTKQVEYSVKPYKFELPMKEYAMPPPHEAIKWKKKQNLGATLKFISPSWLDSYEEPQIPKIPQFKRKPKPVITRKVEYNLKIS